jgi:hypothetical protein
VPIPCLPELRQIVLLTSDLEGSLSRIRSVFGVPRGYRDVDGMAAIGFNHEVVGFDRTYIEVCEPRDPDSRLARKVRERGDSGSLVAVQVLDSAAMSARAAHLGLSPIMTKEYHGNLLAQWSHRDFGTLAEFDEIRPATSWHLAPDVYEARSTSVVQDIEAVQVSVPEPSSMAQRWATVTGGTLGDDGTSVDLGSRSVRFVDRPDLRGLRRIECIATERERVGETHWICGVEFVFV